MEGRLKSPVLIWVSPQLTTVPSARPYTSPAEQSSHLLQLRCTARVRGASQGGFNRWTHRKTFGPLAMTRPAGEGSHFCATVEVPHSAHAVDFVLSDVAEGEGVYDNRGGLDYHFPVEGSEVGLGLGRTTLGHKHGCALCAVCTVEAL